MISHLIRNSLLALTLCGASVPSLAENIKFLTEEWKPFNYKSDSKPVEGFSVTIVDTIAKNLKHKHSVTINPWSRAYKTTIKKNGYALFSMYRTEPREKLFKWVGPLYKVDTVLWGIEGKLNINSLEEAKKYTVVAQKDSAYHQAVKDQGFKKILINASQTDTRMVLAGRADLVPLSAFSLEKLKKVASEMNKDIKWKPYAVLYSKPLYIGFNPGISDDVINQWQAELDKIKSSPLYEELKKKFIEPVIMSY